MILSDQGIIYYEGIKQMGGNVEIQQLKAMSRFILAY